MNPRINFVSPKNATKTILKGNQRKKNPTKTKKHKSTRAKKTGKQSTENIEARYPQQGKLRRDPTYNTESHKAHACFVVVVCKSRRE